MRETEVSFSAQRLRDCCPVLTWVRPAVVDSRRKIPHDRLTSANRLRKMASDHDLMAFLLEFVADVFRDTVFDPDVTTLERQLGKARRFEGSLHIHLVV